MEQWQEETGLKDKVHLSILLAVCVVYDEMAAVCYESRCDARGNVLLRSCERSGLVVSDGLLQQRDVWHTEPGRSVWTWQEQAS